jgi:aryl-alcohol dehydrogenase-like predicted oxidoreductase
MGIGGHHNADFSDDDGCVRLLRHGLDLGLTLIDTAESYGAGHSEELVGRALIGRRHCAVVATKFSAEHSRAADIVAAAEGSLRRLQTDYIDIYQPHWPNLKVPLEETLGALTTLFKAGKIGAVGLSNFSVTAAGVAISALPPDALVLLEQEYSLAERGAEDDALPFCRGHGLMLLAYSPFRSSELLAPGESNQLLFSIAAELGLAPAQLALAWLIRDPNVLAIPKTTRLDHLQDHAAILDRTVPAEVFARLSEHFVPNTKIIPIEAIDLGEPSDERKFYRSLDEAKQNQLGLTPSPAELAAEIQMSGRLDKPIKVLFNAESGRYVLIEGRLKYWAWRIAFDDTKPISANVGKRVEE